MSMRLLHLYIASGHNYFGRHGQAAANYPMTEVQKIDCIADCGIRGDRFYNFGGNYKGQITFFANEVYEALCEQFDIWDKPPSVFRRNVIVRGADLNSLVGQEFEIQGLRFLGTEQCRPCYWMNEAFCPGAEQALKGRGGLRARILSSGILRVVGQARTVDDLFRMYTYTCPSSSGCVT